MKTAGIARAFVLATMTLFAGVFFASTAGAAPLSEPIPDKASQFVVDGTDAYWSIPRKSKSGRRSVTIYRGSFLDRSTLEIARFPDTFDYELNGLAAGGGYVAFAIDKDLSDSETKSDTPTSQVWRISRDGTKRDVIAHGRIDSGAAGDQIFKNGVAYLNDCGTWVGVRDVSDSGSVAVASVASERRSKACGRKKDVDRWRYYEQRLDGTQREIFAKNTAVKSTLKRFKGGYGFYSTSREESVNSLKLEGDLALISFGAAFRLFDSGPLYRSYVRDLRSGILSGPFGPKNSNESMAIDSLSSDGAIALNYYVYVKRGKVRVETAGQTGIFPSPAAPTVFRKRKGGAPLLYCGSHLLSVPAVNSGPLHELDPLTFAIKRTIASDVPLSTILFEFEDGIDCNHDYVYAVAYSRRTGPKVVAYPLN